MTIRSPICTVVGHVDHGKSSILDSIRGTAIVSKEAGAITQAIGASIIPLHIIKKICGNLLNSMNQEFTIPGLLFIDTPGHAAFTNLSTMSRDTWHHVSVTYDGSSSVSGVDIYLDGSVQSYASTTDTLAASTLNDATPTFGDDLASGGSELDGMIDDLKIYNYARTQDQIIEDMNAGHPAGGSPVGSPVAYWKLDEPE